MQTIFSSGHPITATDQVALLNDLLSIEDWLDLSIKGMINKSIKSMLKKYLPIIVDDDSITEMPANIVDQINLIPTLSAFQPFNVGTPDYPEIKRSEANTITLLNGGKQIEDHEHLALQSYYENFDTHLAYIIENKIFMCRKRMVVDAVQHLSGTGEDIPATQDGLIDHYFTLSEYNDRAARDALATV